MSYLLDTHILLWWLADDPKLSAKVRKIIENESNLVFVSAASIWEIIIKKAIGKLEAPGDIEKVLKENQFKELPMSWKHVLAIAQLENFHQDPFDRMLVAQAKSESLTLITTDEKITAYEISCLKGS